jgi:hypothetical protein
MIPRTLEGLLARTKERRGCRLWDLSATRYFYIRYNGEMVGVHRLIFFLANGYWPVQALHTCDNKACIEPSHIYDGTRKQNAQDAVKRLKMSVGTNNSQAKLTEIEVLEIRAARGQLTQKELAHKYNVSEGLIALIQLRYIWTHI